MPSQSHLPRHAAVAPRLPHRRGQAARGLALAALVAIPLLTVAPRAQASTPETYEMCMRTVDSWVAGCVNEADTWVGQLGCQWVGGVMLIGCALAEAVEQLAKSIVLPQYQM